MSKFHGDIFTVWKLVHGIIDCTYSITMNEHKVEDEWNRHFSPMDHNTLALGCPHNWWSILGILSKIHFSISDPVYSKNDVV